MFQPALGCRNQPLNSQRSLWQLRNWQLRVWLQLLKLIAVCLLVCICIFNGTVLATDAPKIERLTPPGGQRGTAVECKLVGNAGGGQLQVVDNSSGLSFVISEKQDSVAVSVSEDAVAGVHWCRFYNEAGATDLIPFIVGLVTESPESEPNNEVSTANAVQLPVTVNGVLEKTGDVDAFSLQMTAGQTLVAEMTANAELGSPMDAVLQIVDLQGTILMHNDDDRGMDPRLVFTATSDGTYVVRTFAFPSAPNSTIALAGAANYIYRLTLTTGPVAEHSFPSFVVPEETSAVWLYGTNIADDGAEIKLPKFDGPFAVVTEGTDIPFTIGQAKTGSVRESSQQANSLTPPFTVVGCIQESGQIDSYSIPGTKGQKLELAVSARSLHSQLDPVLTFTDEAGKVLKEADDRSKNDLDPQAQLTLPADGVYLVKITDRYLNGGRRYFYAFTCEEASPTVTARVAESSIVVHTAEPTDIAVTVTRNNGFDKPLVFSVTGLPAGVSAEPVTSEKQGDSSKKVTLKIVRADDAVAFSGPIQIVGKEESSTLTVVADREIKNSTQVASHIWLTVKPADSKPAAPTPE